MDGAEHRDKYIRVMAYFVQVVAVFLIVIGQGIENISNKKMVLTGVTSGIGAVLLKRFSDPALNNTILAVSRTAEQKLAGYALYTSAKFGMHGFQQAIRLEMPKNMKLTCLYPVGTDTNFFSAGSDGVAIKKPWPIQKPEYIADLMVKGMAKGKKEIYPHLVHLLWPFLNNLPFTRKIFWAMEQSKMRYNFEVLAARKNQQN